jgi:hypothetical protein
MMVLVVKKVTSRLCNYNYSCGCLYHRIDVFVLTNMKNNFVATFILLAVGLIFNDVASVHGKPAISKPGGWQEWEIVQVNLNGTNAIYRCNGTFTKYKEPEECDKAARIIGTLIDLCAATDPIACKLLSIMNQAQLTALQVEQAEMIRRAGS